MIKTKKMNKAKNKAEKSLHNIISVRYIYVYLFCHLFDFIVVTINLELQLKQGQPFYLFQANGI